MQILLSLLAIAAITWAWPATFYRDDDCNEVLFEFNFLHKDTCIIASEVKSYKGNLTSEKEGKYTILR